MMKRKLTLLVDESLIERGKKLGLNLSRYFETQIENYVANFDAININYISHRTNDINKKCGGPDSNRRTPTGMDPESIAFNLARQPPRCIKGLTGDI